MQVLAALRCWEVVLAARLALAWGRVVWAVAGPVPWLEGVAGALDRGALALGPVVEWKRSELVVTSHS